MWGAKDWLWSQFCISSCLNEWIECMIDDFDWFCHFDCAHLFLHSADLLDLRFLFFGCCGAPHSLLHWCCDFAVSFWFFGFFVRFLELHWLFFCFLQDKNELCDCILLAFFCLLFSCEPLYVAFGFWFLEPAKYFFSLYWPGISVLQWTFVLMLLSFGIGESGYLLRRLLLHFVLLLVCLWLHWIWLFLDWLSKVVLIFWGYPRVWQ